jgi:hypothetical protein
VRGRLKEIINRGGEKISPGDIDAVLLSNRKCSKRHRSASPTQSTERMSRQLSFCVREWKRLKVNCATTAARNSVPSKFPSGSTSWPTFPARQRVHPDRRALAVAQFTAGGGSERAMKLLYMRHVYSGHYGRLPCPDRRLCGWIRTSFPGNLCLVHERKHDYNRPEEWTG